MRANAVLPYVLIAPSVLFLAAFFLYPLAQTVALSLSDADGFTFAHYARMAGDLNFKDALVNTFLLVAVVVPLQLIAALGMAQMLTKLRKGRDLVLWVWTIPLGVSDLAAGLVWLALLTDRGYLNSALFALGLIDAPTGWLSYETPVTLFFAIVLAEIWRATAIVLVILVAGLGLVPKEYDEAAQIFGATPWQRFTKITLPLLKPSIQTALTLRTVLAFEVFAVVFALGGTSFPVLVGEAYIWQFQNQNYAVASAYAVLVMAISLGATVFYLRVLRTPPEARG
ncbi:MAG: sugar ABC transporter permease [Azospirillum sp.]|nr:sugar ABC transporter permease [Azospirillum sp.]MCA3267900.1 sugar ABC transporter permease [Azospirillum sp.]MCZ8121849.1 sugar ABC transporter permease [Magnetospirillum sp.]